jgi:hypothetical protein
MGRPLGQPDGSIPAFAPRMYLFAQAVDREIYTRLEQLPFYEGLLGYLVSVRSPNLGMSPEQRLFVPRRRCGPLSCLVYGCGLLPASASPQTQV